MVNKSGNIGTATETAVVRAILTRGFPYAERRRLTGILDRGDITGTPGITWEVKGGATAKTASDAQVDLWLRETERERQNNGDDLGVLVMARKGIGAANAHRWWAVLRSDALGVPYETGDWFPVRLTLDSACRWLVSRGYGSQPMQEATA